MINARLAGSIAYLRGYDPRDPHDRAVVTLITVGSTAQRIIDFTGISGDEDLALYGNKHSLASLAEGITILGGVVGGAVDATMTFATGRTARTVFSAR